MKWPYALLALRRAGTIPRACASSSAARASTPRQAGARARSSPDGLRLTAPDAKQLSRWAVPDWLNPKRGGCGLTYHPSERFSADGHLRAAARGQEFVADIGEREDAREWVRGLFGCGVTRIRAA